MFRLQWNYKLKISTEVWTFFQLEKTEPHSKVSTILNDYVDQERIGFEENMAKREVLTNQSSK